MERRHHATNTTEPSRATRRLPHPSRMPARATLGGAPTPSHHARRAQRNAKRHCLTFSFTSASSTRSDTFIYRVPVEMQTRRRREIPQETLVLSSGEASEDTPLCFHWNFPTPQDDGLLSRSLWKQRKLSITKDTMSRGDHSSPFSNVRLINF